MSMSIKFDNHHFNLIWSSTKKAALFCLLVLATCSCCHTQQPVAYKFEVLIYPITEKDKYELAKITNSVGSSKDSSVLDDSYKYKCDIFLRDISNSNHVNVISHPTYYFNDNFQESCYLYGWSEKQPYGYLDVELVTNNANEIVINTRFDVIRNNSVIWSSSQNTVVRKAELGPPGAEYQEKTKSKF